MNGTRNHEGISAKSVPQYELVSSRGEIFGPYPSAAAAGRDARQKWPHRRQNEDRTGEGWDVQVAGIRT